MVDDCLCVIKINIFKKLIVNFIKYFVLQFFFKVITALCV